MSRQGDRPPVEVDWRLAADPVDLREYDAFGPWIEAVHSERDMPRCFRPHYAEHADARYLLKVPRDEDRADLRPGMDLFQAVVAVHNEGVSVLRHERGLVRTQVSSWAHIVASAYRVDLLVARWSLLLDDGTAIELDHNSAAGRGLAPAMEYVNARIGAAHSPGWRPQLAPAHVGDPFFESRLNQLRRQLQPPVVPVHVERGNRLCLDERNRPRLGNGVMVLDAQGELVIVSRGEPMRSRFFPPHGALVIRVPYERLTSYGLVPPPARRGPSFHVLSLRAGQQVITQWFLDRPDGVTAALDGRGIPREDLQLPAIGLR